MQAETLRPSRTRAQIGEIVSPGEKLFLLAASLSFLLSVYLYFSGQTDAGQFVGIWVPSIIGLGIFFQNIKHRKEVDHG